MWKSIVAIAAAGGIAGCTAYPPPPNPYIARPAYWTAPAGPVASATAPRANVFEGAAVGAAIAGLAGAVWADPNNTGYVTGYIYDGQYHPGVPPDYNPTYHAVVVPH